jgi:hypothetical protein
MHLGELMTTLESDGGAAAALEALGDIVLLAEVRAMGDAHGEAPGEYVANASRRFAARAGDEEWLALMSAMERDADPARAAVERMIRWALADDARAGEGDHAGACSCGGSGGCHGDP